MKRWLVGLLTMLIIITGFSWYLFNYYTDRMIEELANNMDFSLEQVEEVKEKIPENPSVDETPNRESLEENIKIKEDKNKQVEQQSESKQKEEINNKQDSNESASKDENMAVETEKITEEKNEAEKLEDATSNDKDIDNQVMGVEISQEEIKAKSELVTTQDKILAAQILLSSLTKEDIEKIKTMAKDGFSAEEKQQIKSILQSRLTEEEYAIIYGMVQKYK
ncbi:hypothetical protein BHF71_01050 [Vulcanibacillus modesticaldus]|uniref:Uncharacterized protein n=1 Tax=Vulcanibacillus modesticaldus TaxID=337097 RepID=A0A1D2YVU4_9BACI|nr:hypothetical protein [Vulcanibacillus modesticaldus]OEF99793.1 hypothetical protein BHF71_01050 [Vulcanibacillus modesticaldus]